MISIRNLSRFIKRLYLLSGYARHLQRKQRIILNATEKLEKPHNVRYAEWALWAWTAWACLFGIYQSWINIPEMEKMLNEQLQGAFTLDPQLILEMTVAGYGLLAAISAWIVLKIGAGKNWARGSLLGGFALEIAWAAVPPYHGILEYLTDVPDIGLQGYALYLLYAEPGRAWFRRAKASKAYNGAADRN